MTEFISGSSGTGKGSCIIEKIRERLGNGKKKYLIVPEQQTVLWEARICRALPASSALELEVVNFKRLADTVFRTTGGLSRVFTGEAKKILMMWNAVSSVRDSLTIYGSSEGHDERYVASLLETLSELRRRGVSPSALDEAREQLDGGGNSELVKKLSDISLIFSAYSALEEGSGSSDPDYALEMLAKVLREQRFFEGTDVFFDSFYSLTPVESEILYYIMRDAGDVFMTFTLDSTSRGVHFDHIKKFYNSALSYAARCSREVSRITLEGNKKCVCGDLLYLEKNLWDFSAPKYDGICDSVKVIRCLDRYEEARAAGAEIERAIHEGLRLSEIAVIARDIEAYRGIIDVRLDSLNIPYHLSKRSGITTSPVLTFVTSLLEAVTDGAKAETVVKLVKTGLCPVTERESDDFEEYVFTWNIRGKKSYLSDEEWRMNPAGFRSGISDWGHTVLEDANTVRKLIKGPLCEMFSLFSSGSAPIVEICKKIYSILVSFGAGESLASDAEELRRLGRTDEADKLDKYFSAVVDSLSAMAVTIPDKEVSPDTFSRLFFAVASSFDVASIPASLDVVTLGSATGVRAENVKLAILIGCSEGEFPASPSQRGFFTESDKETLESVGVILSDGKELEQSEELFRFWRCVTMPSEKLVVTYHVSGEEASSTPSVGASQILRLTEAPLYDWSEISKQDSVWSVHSARDAAVFVGGDTAKAVRDISDEFPEAYYQSDMNAPLSAEGDRIDVDVSRELAKRRLHLSQTKIDRFSECPFSYFMEFGLKLERSERAAITAVNIGTIVHRTLELFFTRSSGLELAPDDERIEKMTADAIKDAVAEATEGSSASSRQKFLFKRLNRYVLVLIKDLVSEFSETKFRPVAFEVKMSEDDMALSPLEYAASSGRKVVLTGTIDRVDTYTSGGKTYVRVVDYKTGQKHFSRSDIQKGLNLQLMIYLFTLWKGKDCKFRQDISKGGEIVPASMIYLPVVNEVSSDTLPSTFDEAKKLAYTKSKRSGLILNDNDSLYAMGCEEKGKYRPSNRDASVSLEEFEQLYEQVKEVIEKISDEITEGVCRSDPADMSSYGPCSRCGMKPVCRHIGERRENGEQD